MSDKILAGKLKKLREGFGYTLTEAAEKLGFTNYQTLISIENGLREVKSSELARFSKIYYCGIPELLSEKEQTCALSFFWRNDPKTKKVKKIIEAEIMNICRNYSLLENLLNIKPEKSFFNITIDDIRLNNNIDELALKTSKMLNLGSRPAYSLQHVLEQDYAAKIIFQPLESGSAISTVHPEMGYIMVINSNEAVWRQNFDLAHELFHILTWGLVLDKAAKEISFYGDLEKKADRFASNLLLPEEEVEKEINKIYNANQKVTISDIVDIAKDFDVSAQALIYRLVNLRYITFEAAEKILSDEDIKILIASMRKIKQTKKPVQERLNILAARCLRKGLISRGKFSEITGTDRSDIDKFIELLGLMENEGSQVEIIYS